MINIYRSKKSLTGQAILELAIFGAILIMLLGVLINYGLRFSLEQRTTMDAFRKALRASGEAAGGGQASVTLVQDKHIPNPTNPFGIGSVTPFFSSASVIRSWDLSQTADTYEELPQTTIWIQDRPFPYKTAGFRDEPNVPEAHFDKYNEIYGSQDSAWWEKPGEEGCLEERTVIPPEGGEPVTECVQPTQNIRIIDSCEGEIINLDACRRQCRMITEASYCRKECERGLQPGSDRNCETVCNQDMQIPWYCKDNALDNIFAFAANKPKAMGIQPDYTKQTVVNNSLNKAEREGGQITTTDNIEWRDTTYRNIVYNQHLNPDGTARAQINIIGDEEGEPTNQIPTRGVGESTIEIWESER